MPVVLITGASRGIGRACAIRFAKEGWSVAANYNSGEMEANSLMESLRSTDVEAMAVRADVSDAEEVRAMMGEVREKYGGLDSLVLNAGIYMRAPFRDHKYQDWKRMMEVNLEGAYLVTREALPLMEDRETPTIVFVSSQLALRGSAHGPAYSTSKAAMHGFMKSLALELAPRFRVNALAPGVIDTDIIGYDTPEQREERKKRIPLGRIGTPEEMANAVWFLASDQSTFMTGAVLHANGGVLMP